MKEPEYNTVTGEELEEGCYMMAHDTPDGLCSPATGCPGCAQERRRRASYDLYNALQSAASTAHYRGTLRGASDSCHGTFEECTNCKRWKDVLKKATGEL